MSSINKEWVKKTIAEIRENNAKLEACAGPHDFQPHVLYPGVKMVRKHRCTLCGGTVDTIARIWYERGIAHGKKIKS